MKMQLSVITFPCIQILIFLCKTIQNDHNRLLHKFENDQKNLIVLGVVDMRQLLLRGINFLFRLSIFLLFMRVESDVT